jgi:anti-sigma factor RsiW
LRVRSQMLLPPRRPTGDDWVVIIDSNKCPPDPEAVAEAYLMGTLSREQATAFEDHFVACSPCATVLQNTAEYVDAMRAAARKQRSEPPS